MRKSRYRKKVSTIQTLNDLNRERAKTKERLAYTESLLKEDVEDLKEQVKPATILSSAEKLIPFLSNVVPLSKVTSALFQNVFKGKKQHDDAEDDEEEAQSTNYSAGSKFKKTMYQLLLPFGVGIATTLAIFKGKRKS